MSVIRSFIPVATPDIGVREIALVTEAVTSGWVSSIGVFVERFEREFAAYCQTQQSIAISNGTDSLFLALKALGVGPGDEVIVPALTFAAVPAVVHHVGATPVVVDVDLDHWNLDIGLVEQAISPRTRVIMAVHLYGHPCEMAPLLELAQAHQIHVLEDAAEAHGARYKGQPVGSFGIMGSFSFYGNKILTTGEGGALVGNDAEMLAKVRYLKDHAMDPRRRYYHTEAGYNCRMTNLQAALGCAQLERIDEQMAWRNQVLDWYREELGDTPGLRLNPQMPWAEPVNWLVCAVLDVERAGERDAILAALRAEGIDTRPFFVPIPELPPYTAARVVGRTGNTAPVADYLGRAGFNLPTLPDLTREEVAHIAQVLSRQLAHGVEL